MTAALSALRALTGKESAGEAVSVIALKFAQLDKITESQMALDASSRRELVGELVKLGAEVPATAWEGDAEKRLPVERLRNESVDSMRSRVTALRASRPEQLDHTPPVNDSTLTPEEEKLCAAFTPAQKARFVALRASRTNRRAS